MRLCEVMNAIVDGVQPEYDWSGMEFDVRVEVKDPATGELDIRFDINGLPEISLEVEDVAFEYYDYGGHKGWEVTDWSGDITPGERVEKNGRYYSEPEGNDDTDCMYAIDALPNLLNRYWPNPYSRNMKFEDVDEDQMGTVEWAIGQTEYTKFYDVCGVYYGRKEADTDIDGQKPMDTSAFAQRLVMDKLEGKI